MRSPTPRMARGEPKGARSFSAIGWHSGRGMRAASTKVIGDLAVAPLRVGILPLSQVVFGPAQGCSVPGGVWLARVCTGFEKRLHRCQGARTDCVVQWGTVCIQVSAGSIDVRPCLGLPIQCREDQGELLFRLARHWCEPPGVLPAP